VSRFGVLPVAGEIRLSGFRWWRFAPSRCWGAVTGATAYPMPFPANCQVAGGCGINVSFVRVADNPAGTAVDGTSAIELFLSNSRDPLKHFKQKPIKLKVAFLKPLRTT
jgi:hypothetical protein